MDIDKLSHYCSRAFFAAALVLFLVAVAIWVMVMMGGKNTFGYMPGRLVEFAAMFLIPVITVLLRQIREELRKK